MKYNVYLKMVLDLPDISEIEQLKNDNETVDEWIEKEVNLTVSSVDMATDHCDNEYIYRICTIEVV